MLLKRPLSIQLVTFVVLTPMLTPFSTSSFFARLKVDPTHLDPQPTIQKLKILQESHLEHIPFENTAQHGVIGGAACLDEEKTAHKVLAMGRGGFCFELNGLFAAFLENLGYKVTRVPARVFSGDSYPEEPTHMILIVDAQNGCDSSERSKYFVDVGFGEPPIHPLQYDLLDGTTQTTPEGMCSRLLRKDCSNCEKEESVVELSWQKHGVNGWSPRLEWDYCSSILNDGPKLSEFQDALSLVQEPDSIFSQKLIVCRLTRDHKLVLAGNRFRKTGPPRFQYEIDGNLAIPPLEIRELESANDARSLLERDFGEPLASTDGLELTRSKTADPRVWGQM